MTMLGREPNRLKRRHDAYATSSRDLTVPEQRVYEALEHLASRNGGWPVTVREICAEAGYRSTSTAHWGLMQLERRGLVESHRKCGFRLAESRAREPEAVPPTRRAET